MSIIKEAEIYKVKYISTEINRKMNLQAFFSPRPQTWKASNILWRTYLQKCIAVLMCRFKSLHAATK